jgi:hypothetical protein
MFVICLLSLFILNEMKWPMFKTSNNYVTYLIGIIIYPFTLDVKSVWNENLGGILGGTQC